MQQLTVPAEVQRLKDVNDFVHACLGDLGSPADLFRLDLAVEEIYVNIASYAYPEGGGEATITCDVLPDPPRVELSFSDSGVPFDPLARPDADTSAEANMNRIGGLGLLLVKKNMDEVRYRFEDGKNILWICKRFKT